MSIQLIGWIDILVHRSSMDITLPWRSQRALPLVPACRTHVQLLGGILKWQKVETIGVCHSMTCWRFCDGLISGAPRVATLATLTALGCYRDLPFCFSQYFVWCHDLMRGSMVSLRKFCVTISISSPCIPHGPFRQVPEQLSQAQICDIASHSIQKLDGHEDQLVSWTKSL